MALNKLSRRPPRPFCCGPRCTPKQRIDRQQTLHFTFLNLETTTGQDNGYHCFRVLTMEMYIPITYTPVTSLGVQAVQNAGRLAFQRSRFDGQIAEVVNRGELQVAQLADVRLVVHLARLQLADQARDLKRASRWCTDARIMRWSVCACVCANLLLALSVGVHLRFKSPIGLSQTLIGQIGLLLQVRAQPLGLRCQVLFEICGIPAKKKFLQ